MDFVDYWNQVVVLSRKSGERHQALLNFLDKKPQPSGVDLLEYDRLRTEYAEAFREWINFSEEHADSRFDGER